MPGKIRIGLAVLMVGVVICVLGAVIPATTMAAPKTETPPGYYSIYWPAELGGWPSLQKIDTETGRGTLIAPLQLDPLPGHPDLLTTPFGLTFDTDGTAYTMVSWTGFDFNPANAFGQFAKVNMMTGELTYIGPVHTMNFAGPEIDGCGDFYVTGFEVGIPEFGGVPPVLFGDSNLYRVNKQTGDLILIGDTGRTDWMDLDFDKKGRLWATTKNQLYVLDTETGASTFVTEIYGVPQSEIPGTCAEDWPWMEVMSIAFDAKDVLWATAMKGFSFCVDNNAPVMMIDTATGIATIVGYTGGGEAPFTGGYNHGGDIVGTKAGGCKGRD